MWLFRPDPADVFVRREALQGLEPARVVVGVEEQLKVCCELLMVVVVASLDGGILDGAVHAFDLAIGPRMVRLCQPVLDAMLAAEPVEQVHAELRCRTGAAAGRVAELDAVVGQHRVDVIRHGLDDSVQELRGALPVGRMRQTCDGEL